MSLPSLKGERVIVSGNHLYEGHRDAWRSGVIVSDPEERDVNTVLVLVEHPPRGREKKPKRMQWFLGWLLRDTPDVRTKLASVGIAPDKDPKEWTCAEISAARGIKQMINSQGRIQK